MNKSITETKAIFHLAIPLIFNLLGYMGMQLVDVIMIGQLGPLALAASAAGNVMYVIALVGGIGVLMIIGTLAGEAFGEGKPDKITAIVQHGFLVAIIISIFGLLFVWHAPTLLLMLKQPIPVVNGAREFLHGLIYGYIPCLFFVVCREFLTAIVKPRIIMFITFCALPLNALLNYILMYGKFGFPKLGIMGVGLSTSIVELLMFLTISFYITKQSTTKKYRIFCLHKPNAVILKRILRLGLPVGISLMVEELLFVVTTLLIGYFGIISLAAHQIALQCVYFAAMIPIGISQATAVRVSHAIGLGEPVQAQRTAYIAIACGTLIALFIASLYWFAPNLVVSLFINPTTNQAVAMLAAKLVTIIAIFHIIDAVQIIMNGALRGYQDTFVPMLLGLFSFWIIGIGSGYIFGFRWHYGAVGLWWGLALGITVAALLFQWRLRTKPHQR